MPPLFSSSPSSGPNSIILIPVSYSLCTSHSNIQYLNYIFYETAILQRISRMVCFKLFFAFLTLNGVCYYSYIGRDWQHLNHLFSVVCCCSISKVFLRAPFIYLELIPRALCFSDDLLGECTPNWSIINNSRFQVQLFIWFSFFIYFVE